MVDTVEPKESVNILVVDDRPENVVALKAILSDPLYNIVTASSGPEALRCILLHDFALILLDVLMPEMDGFEVAALIKRRERSKHIPIIFLTAAGKEIGFVFRGYSVGAVDYLVKPVEPDVVRAKVAVFVDLYRKGRQLERQAELLRETERREQEHRVADLLRESSERYRNLAEAIPQIVWTTRPSGELDYVNRRWVDYAGLSLEATRAAGWTNLLHPEDAERCLDLWHASLLSGAVYQSECRLRRADGAYRWYLGRAVPELDRSGAIVAWLGTYTDIDDQKRLYESAQEAIRARDEFLSIASHELKTPLTSLQLQVQSILRSAKLSKIDDFSPERMAAKGKIVERQVDRLARLINELLDVSRITSGRLQVELEEMDLAAVVRDIVARFGEEIGRVGCRVDVQASEPTLGLWDRVRMEQVVTNLLSNALKYGPGKPVLVSVTPRGPAAQLAVVDQGIGIAPEQHERIFGRFERAVSARQYGGLGLGLYIVRQIVEAHGGTIRLESRPDVGSTFIVDLPCEPAQVGPSPQSAEPLLVADASRSGN